MKPTTNIFNYRIIGTLIVLIVGYAPASLAQFVTNGNASSLGEGCYQLTPAAASQAGSIWNSVQLDLSESFDITADIYYGDGSGSNGGADGFAFVLQSIGTSALGGTGGGLGFSGLSPSVAAAFRTWTFDNMSFVANGAYSTPLSSTSTLPAADDAFHEVRITWDPSGNIMRIYFDGTLSVTWNNNIVNNYFSGNTAVYWGFTAGTGGANAVHEVCNIRMHSQFNVIGNASNLGGGCYQLTPAANSQTGSIWNTSTQIDLSRTFDISFDLYYGDGSSGAGGADGVTFTLQNIGTSALGGSGGGMGYDGLSPSVAAAFKTYTYDYMSFYANGAVSPVASTASLPNADDSFHKVLITWDPTNTTMQLYFDGALQVTWVNDIVNNYFSGNPTVYWGFTAATGGANADHRVCNIQLNTYPTTVPTLSQWGIIILILLILAFEATVIWRKKYALAISS